METIKPISPTMKRRWLAALRSGEYQKINGVLMMNPKDNGRCALGVLNSIYKKPDNYKWLEGVLGPSGTELIWKVNDRDFYYDRNFENVANWIEANVPVKESK